MKKRAYKRSKRTWFRVGVWSAVATLLVLSIGWLFPAQAATPTWWDCNYGYRKQITVSAVSAVPVNYSTTLTFDHAALVTAGKSQADGDDIRIVYWNGTNWVELDRFLDPDSTWNTTTTKVWFKAQAAIASSSSDSDYYLYYGHPSAVNPPAVPQNVFFFYDGYESGDLSAWDASYAGTGDSITADPTQPYHGTYSLQAQIDSDDTGGPQADVWKNFAGETTLYAKIHIYLPPGFSLPRDPGDPTDRPYVVVMQFIHDTGTWTNLISTTINEDMTLYMWNDSCTAPSGGGTCEAYGFLATNTISTGTWHTLEMMATVSPTAGEARLWLDGNLEIEATGINLGSNSITRFSTGHYWSHPRPNNDPNTHYTDDSLLRLWVNPEPTTSLGAEEANDCTPGGDPSICTWQNRRKLTFNNSAQAENLVDFPVLVVLNSSNIDYSQTQDAGQDLRFYDADGTTKLAHEIEQWNELGNSYVWVKVPQIDASSNTDYILMYYGNATVADGQDPTAVWSNGFEAVYHLHNDFTDSTGIQVNATNVGSTDTPGMAADGENFDGSSQYINTNFISNYGASQNFTWEGWFNVNNIGGSDDIMGIEDRGGGDNSEIRLAIREASAGQNPVEKYDTWIRPDSGTNYAGTPLISPSSGNWHYSVLLRNGSTGRLYLDGVEVDNKINISTAALTFPVTLLIGAQWQTDTSGQRNFMKGSLDEIRTSTTARSAGWIAAQYLSMTDAFITFGSGEPNGTSVSYFTPDAAAAGMSVPVTIVGSICAVPTVTTSSSDIVVGPSIMTDNTGAVVSTNGSALSTVFFVKPSARPTTGITVSLDGVALTETFDIVIPTPDPNITSGSVSLAGRSDRGTSVLGGLTVGAGATLSIGTGDTDGATAGNQGYLPAMILVKGDVNIAGTVDVNGQNGANGGASSGGAGGVGGPGGGGGGGGGVSGGGGGGSVTHEETVTAGKMGTSLTTGNITGGTDQLFVASVAVNWNINITSITGGGLTWTLQKRQCTQSRIDMNVYTAYGTATNFTVAVVVASWTNDLLVTVDRYSGVDSTTPVEDPVGHNPLGENGGCGAGTGSSPELTTGSTVANGVHFVALTSEGRPVTSYNSNYTQESYNPGSDGVESWTFDYKKAATGDDQFTATLTSAGSWATAGFVIRPGGGGSGGTAAPGAAGYSGGGGGGAKGTGSGADGGAGTGAAGAAASGTSGGAGGVSLAGSTGGGAGMANTEVSGGDGGGGGTGDPFGSGGSIGGPFADGGPGGQGGGGGGAAGGSPGGGGGGAYTTAGGTLNGVEGDAGFGGTVYGTAQLVPLAGGSGGAGGGPNKLIGSVGAGGGGGGGAIMLYATGSVSVTGTITANGGNGGAGYNGGAEGSAGGGGGSGGAIFVQSGDVTVGSNLTTAGGTGGTGGDGANAAGGDGGSGRIRIDGLASGSVPGTAGSKFIGPMIEQLVDATVNGRADGGSSITLYVYDETGAQVTGSPYSASASGATGSVGTWTISGVTFPSGTNYLAVKQTSGGTEVFGPGRSTRGIHLIDWREVY